MKRRTALSMVGAVASVGTAGCLFSQTNSEPRFTLRDVQSYVADEGTALVVGGVEKQGDTKGDVTVRAELLIDDEHDHASIQTFVIPADMNERTLALPFTSESSFYADDQFTARAKIIRNEETDGEWVTEGE